MDFIKINMKHIQIEIGEWWFKGCFIQEQTAPQLSKYIVFADNETQTHIGTATTMKEAKQLCIDNEVKDYKYGVEAFI
jgi:hypothetical protein